MMKLKYYFHRIINTKEALRIIKNRFRIDEFQQDEGNEPFQRSLFQLSCDVQGEQTDLQQVLLDVLQIFEGTREIYARIQRVECCIISHGRLSPAVFQQMTKYMRTKTVMIYRKHEISNYCRTRKKRAFYSK